MRDISAKIDTMRTALARARLLTSAHVPRLLELALADKGDALSIARVAAILGAKNTWQTIPLCHQIPIWHADVTYDVEDHAITITATATTVAPTGVEMEALTSASIAALTLYDVLKPHAADMRITDIELLEKTGGKSDFRPGSEALRCMLLCGEEVQTDDGAVSVLREAFARWSTVEAAPVARGTLADTLRSAAEAGVDIVVVVTSEPDRVESTRACLDRELPGVMDQVRGYMGRRSPMAMREVGAAGLLGDAVILTIPADEAAARHYASVLLPHAFALGSPQEEPS